MTLKIIRPESYVKREIKFFGKHRELINQYAKAFNLLSLNPSHPPLRLPRIKTKPSHSISINMKYTVLFTLRLLDNGQVVQIDIGDYGLYSQ